MEWPEECRILNNSYFSKTTIPVPFLYHAILHPVLAVGNIPYEATEEKLKEIFSEVGPVLSLK